MSNRKILKFLEFLKEAKNLDLKVLGTLSKDNRLRGDVLVDKIRDHDLLTTNKKGEEKKQIVVKNDKEIISDITDDSGRYDPSKSEYFFKTDTRYDGVIDGEDDDGEDELYKLNDIEKTEDFGSSGGSSLGTTKTKIQECIQCLYLALKQEKRILLNTRSFYRKVLSFQDTNTVGTPMDITQDIFDSFHPGWATTWVKIANALYSVRNIPSESGRRDSILSTKIEYKFCHREYIGGVVAAINNKYKSFRLSININKWNPADIWAVSIDKENNIIDIINACASIVELNSRIDTYFDKKLLIGISLKKLSSVNENPDIIINKETPVPRYEFSSIKLSPDPFTSIGLHVLSARFSEIYGKGFEILKIDSSSGSSKSSDINFEVLGKTARHGKIALSRINQILDTLNMENIPSFGEFDLSDEDMSDRIVELNDELVAEYGVNKSTRIYANPRYRSRLVSKYQALLFAKLLNDNAVIIYDEVLEYTISDVILQKIIYYAMSIKNDRFICPKYARFI